MATLASAAVLLSGGVIAAQTTTKKAKAATTDYVKVLYAANLRQGPGLQYGTLRTLQQGETYKTYTTKQADGYTWYNLGGSQWVASAGVQSGTANLGTGGTATGQTSGTTTQTGWVEVNTPANLRSGAGLTFGVLRTLGQGEAYKYFATKQADGFTWYNLGGSQWVAGGAVTAQTGLYPGQGTSNGGSSAANNAGGGDAIVTPTPNQSGKVRVNYAANIRQGAGTSYAVTRTVAAGGTYSYSSAQQADGYTWYRIGNNEWIASAAVSVVSDAAAGNTNTDNTTPADQTKASAVVALARQQLGKPYVWGGKGPAVFDCSGLMYYVFLNAAGVNIGGWTVPQESSGREVSLSALQPGDILFWGPKGNTYHDALYIGNNQYIAAPEPGQVVQIQTISQGFEPNFAVRVL